MPASPTRLLGYAAALATLACSGGEAPGRSATGDSARIFLTEMARAVTTRGPAAWRDYFADDSTFYMAAEGQMVFPSGASAAQGITQLEPVIAEIELQFGDTIRVDVLAPGLAAVAAPYWEARVDRAGQRVDERGFFTGLAEHRGARWVLRNAHWSVSAAPAGP